MGNLHWLYQLIDVKFLFWYNTSVQFLELVQWFKL